MSKTQLKVFGLTQALEEQATNSRLALGRITGQNRTLYDVMTEQGSRQASVSGRLNNVAIDAQDYPAVGTGSCFEPWDQ
ncbi:hypothetical protein [Pediococcus parvulus]|uniref:hypothetical protein n=1 Tax=Pediococcus parvulus TaxID=54062 RepID=UPI00345EB4B1